MNAVEVVDNFCEALRRAGMVPRDVSPILGLHLSSLYRILAGKTPTTEHTLRSLEMATVFLRWAKKYDTMKDSPLTAYSQWISESQG